MSHKGTSANSVEPDEMVQSVPSVNHVDPDEMGYNEPSLNSLDPDEMGYNGPSANSEDCVGGLMTHQTLWVICVVSQRKGEETRVMQKVLSLIGFLSFIPGIFLNASLHLNGVLNS